MANTASHRNARLTFSATKRRTGRSGIVKDLTSTTVFRGVTPFWCADILRLSALIAIPAVSLLLPRLFFG